MDDDIYAEDFDVYFKRAATVQQDYYDLAECNSYVPDKSDWSANGNRRVRSRRASLQTNDGSTETNQLPSLVKSTLPLCRRSDSVKHTYGKVPSANRQSSQCSPRLRRRLSSTRSAIDDNGADHIGQLSPDVRLTGPSLSPRHHSSGQSTPSTSGSPGASRRHPRLSSSSSAAGSDSPRRVRRATSNVDEQNQRLDLDQFLIHRMADDNVHSSMEQPHQPRAVRSLFGPHRRAMSLTPSPHRSKSYRAGEDQASREFSSAVAESGDGRASDGSTSTEASPSKCSRYNYGGKNTDKRRDARQVERHFSISSKGVVSVRAGTSSETPRVARAFGQASNSARPRCSRHFSFDGSSSDSDERTFAKSAASAGLRRRASCTAAVVITDANRSRPRHDEKNKFRDVSVGLDADDEVSIVNGAIDAKTTSSVTTHVFNVLVAGESGVGKSELIRLFANTNTAQVEDLSGTNSSSSVNITVTVDGRQTRLVFVECSPFCGASATAEADAYLVIYSMTDRASFRWAVSFISDVTHHTDDVAGDRSDAVDLPAVILVANKADLVRKRQVSASEANDVCKARHCKYAELSAALGHCVDTLLVGVASQLELRRRQRLMTKQLAPSGRRSSRSLWATSTGRIKAVTKFFVRGLTQRQQLQVHHSPCTDLMNL